MQAYRLGGPAAVACRWRCGGHFQPIQDDDRGAPLVGRSTGCVGQTCLFVGSLDLFSACSAGGLAAGAPRRATPCRECFFVLPTGMPRPAPFGGPAGRFALRGELPPQQLVLRDLPRTC